MDKDDSLALLRLTYAKFLAPELLQTGLPEKFVKWVPEAGVPKDT